MNVEEVRAWVEANVPEAWREAGRRGGAAAVREVRTRAEYEAWYPVFARSGLVVPTWAPEYGGLGVSPAIARAIDAELRPYNLGRLNPLGLNNTAAALFAFGREEQRLRFLPPMVRNEEKWCQLFSEPGAGSDLASLATRAERDGDTWLVTGQKVWSTWAHFSDFAIVLARTDPDAPKRAGITYLLLDLHQPGVEVRPLRHIGGDVEFNEVFLERAMVPDAHRVGEIGAGWKVANATLAGERQMVAGAGSGGVDRIGGRGSEHVLALAQTRGRAREPLVRQELMRVYSEERIRDWTNQRVPRVGEDRAGAGAGKLGRQGAPGCAQPADPAPCDRTSSARPRSRGRPTVTRPPRCAACCAAGRTRSKAARPRSTRTSWASGCSACRGSPIRGKVRPGVRSREAERRWTIPSSQP